MKKITITLYGWSDFKKWLWDQFFFPRRKTVSDWLVFHNSEIKEKIVSLYYDKRKLDYSKTEDMYEYREFELAVRKIIDEQTQRTTELIMMR